MGELSPWHLLILAAVFVLLFGAKKLPDAARSVGRSLRIFKSEIKGLHDDDAPAAAPAPAPPPPAAISGSPSVGEAAPAPAATVPPAGQGSGADRA